ncbi:MAG TPA: redoxin domain-containing protein [Pyrinomonadaceae bacterium]|nr:redoxin domain-containing protein [Pyrinomonadaceae bacterium]
MKTVVKVIVLLVAFLFASGATYVAMRKWHGAEPVRAGKQEQDILEGVSGPIAGETVTLPTLETPDGEKVDLANGKEERVLCVFVGSQCSGCTQDRELWRDLHDEATRHGVAFYVVDIADDLSDLQRFKEAYNLDQLPLLFDPTRKAGPKLKIGFLPQYVLFTQQGRVIHRWDGIRHYDKRAGPEQLTVFFSPPLIQDVDSRPC